MSIKIQTTKKLEDIEYIIVNYYKDPPLIHFSSKLKKIFSCWLSNQQNTLILQAKIDDKFVGFLFAHNLLPGFWKKFLFENLVKHPIEILVFLTYFIFSKLFSKRTKVINNNFSPTKKASFGYSNRPFQHSPIGNKLGVIQFIYVDKNHRGKGIAGDLLKNATQFFKTQDIKVLEAHISHSNISSINTFFKNNWQITQMQGKDYLAQKNL